MCPQHVVSTYHWKWPLSKYLLIRCTCPGWPIPAPPSADRKQPFTQTDAGVFHASSAGAGGQSQVSWEPGAAGPGFLVHGADVGWVLGSGGRTGWAVGHPSFHVHTWGHSEAARTPAAVWASGAGLPQPHWPRGTGLTAAPRCRALASWLCGSQELWEKEALWLGSSSPPWKPRPCCSLVSVPVVEARRCMDTEIWWCLQSVWGLSLVSGQPPIT